MQTSQSNRWNTGSQTKRSRKPKGPIPVPSKLPEVDIGPLSRKIDSLIQKAVLEGAKMTLKDGLKLESKVFAECLTTEDMKIGMDTFLKQGPKVNAPFVHK